MQQLIEMILRPFIPIIYFWKRYKIRIMAAAIILMAAYIAIR